jgi:hypothetical protein
LEGGAWTAARGVVVALLEKVGVGEAPRVVVELEERGVGVLRAIGVI